MDKEKVTRVLKIIENDSCAGAQHISSLTGIPADEIAQILVYCEEEHLILKRNAVINWEKLHKEQVWAVIEVKITPEVEVGFDAIAERLSPYPQVRSVYLASGTYDLILLVEGENIREISEFVSDRIAPIKGVQAVETHFMLKRYKESGEKTGQSLQPDTELKRQQALL